MGNLSDLNPQDLAALVETGRQLNSEVDIASLVRTILERAAELTDSPDGSVLLADEKGLYFATAIGVKGPMLLEEWGVSAPKRVPLEKGKSKAGEAFASGKTLVIQKLSADPGHFKEVDRETRKESYSMICVVLQHGDQRIGVIQILNKRSGEYTDRDQLLLEAFAGQAAVAIVNARLIEDLLASMGLYSASSAFDRVRMMRQPPRREKLSLLFADMRGSTRLAQVINDIEATHHMIEQHVTLLADCVLAHGGTVNKFLGDGLFAFFPGDSCSEKAVRCAFEMTSRFAELRQRWIDESAAVINFIDIGIGITTDKVMIGAMGNSRVRDYALLGSAVNLADAFTRVARNHKRILVDQTTWNATKDFFCDFEGPIDFELRKADQPAGVFYKQYWLKRMRPAQRCRVFISHNKNDREFVETHLLEPFRKLGIETWFAKQDIIPGQDYVAAVQQGLATSDWVLAVISEKSAGSDWVRVEIGAAIDDARFQGRILPLRLDKTPTDRVHAGLHFLQGETVEPAETLAGRLAARFLGKSAGA